MLNWLTSVMQPLEVKKNEKKSKHYICFKLSLIIDFKVLEGNSAICGCLSIRQSIYYFS